jgi:hypothetical protein
MSKPSIPVFCIYRPRSGAEEEFQALCARHWPTLERAGLVTGEPARVWKGRATRAGQTVFVELYSWRDEDAIQAAHESPELMKVWEPMGQLCDGQMEFLHVESVPMPYARE